VYERFFRHHPLPVSGKAISSRHFEPIGTETVQILLEGAYNGILQPDTHYIQLRRDHANLDEVLDRFRDPNVRAVITAAALTHVLEGHTYAHRVDQLLAEAYAVRT
jgi:spore maturation protein CgeB